jgi:hypothetical protein
MNGSLFNHSVHLSSFWCEMGEQTTVEVGSSIRFGL